MPRPMVARYKGRCRKCGKPILPGDSIIFGGKGNSIHLLCDDSPKPDEGKSPSGQGIPQPKRTEPKGSARTVIDFPDLKRLALEIYEGNLKSLPINGHYADELINRQSESFQGYSRAQAQDWLKNGYRSDALGGLEDFAPPIREKRRFVYGEEGDEIDLSAAWAGEDNFMTHWTKREVIPGISLVFEMAFVCSTDAKVIIDYERWLARATEAISSAGIDPEISIAFPGKLCGTWNQPNHTSLVRVKRANEAVDIHAWSAMLSPAAYRSFGFLSKIMHGEELGGKVGAGLSTNHGGNEWACYYEPEHAEIVVRCPFSPRGVFPEQEMTSQLKAAIEILKRGGA